MKKKVVMMNRLSATKKMIEETDQSALERFKEPAYYKRFLGGNVNEIYKNTKRHLGDSRSDIEEIS